MTVNGLATLVSVILLVTSSAHMIVGLAVLRLKVKEVLLVVLPAIVVSMAVIIHPQSVVQVHYPLYIGITICAMGWLGYVAATDRFNSHPTSQAFQLFYFLACGECLIALLARSNDNWTLGLVYANWYFIRDILLVVGFTGWRLYQSSKNK